MRLSTTCLAIGKDCRVVALEAAQHEVLSARLKQLLLLRILVEHSVKLEHLLANRDLVEDLLGGDARFLLQIPEFSADVGPDSDGDFD